MTYPRLPLRGSARWLATGRFWVLLAGVLCLSASAHADFERRAFSIPKGPALESVRQVARESGANVLIDPRAARGVKTRAIEGRFTPLEALERLLEGTPLIVIEDERSLSFAVRRRPKERPSQVRAESQTQTPTETNPEMTELKSLIQKLVRAAAVATVAAGFQAATGQEEDENDIFELSPFQVDASEDSRYRALTTLSGTRLESNIRDLGVPVSVVTKEFLEDVNATSVNEFLNYTTNTETGGIFGNFSGADQFSGGNGRDSGVRVLEGRRQPQGDTRVREIANADLTRNLFLTDIPMDSYNTDRVSINRGPNAVLFGLGSPGGIIDTNIIEAHFNNKAELGFRFDTEGTVRSTIDVNRKITDKLAIRVAGLYEEEEFEQEPTFEEDHRLFASLRYDLLEATTLRLSAETGDIRSRRPNPVSPIDDVSLWWDPQGGSATHTVDARIPNRRGALLLRSCRNSSTKLALFTLSPTLKRWKPSMVVRERSWEVFPYQAWRVVLLPHRASDSGIETSRRDSPTNRSRI